MICKTQILACLIYFVCSLSGCMSTSKQDEQTQNADSPKESLHYMPDSLRIKDSILIDSLAYEMFVKRRDPDSTYIDIFIDSHLKAELKPELTLDYGRFHYLKIKNSPKHGIKRYTFIKHYIPNSDSVHVHFKIAQKDTSLFLIPKKHDRVVFRFHDTKIHAFTNEEYDWWAYD